MRSNIKSYGLLEVRQYKRFVMFSYMGNMSSREDVEIRDCVEALYGKESFTALLERCKFHSRDPSYSWHCTVPNNMWDF